MAKNQQNGLTQPLDSEATKNSQPTKLFIPGAEDITWANPKSPSTNPETRREKYNLGSDNMYPPSQPGNVEYDPNLGKPIRYEWDDWMLYIPEKWWETTFGSYKAPTYTTSIPQETSGKRELKSYYSDLWWKEAMDEINAIFNQKWINTASKYFQEIYWESQATALSNAMQAQIDLWKAIVEKRWFMWHTSTNADWVKNFAEEVYKAVAYNVTHWIANDINEIAKNTWWTPEEVQAVLTNDAYRLVELTDEYKNREFRQYYRQGEDATLQMEYNRQQYQNNKKYSDYQFESTMHKLERSLFDSERAARTQSAIFWMTWTRYTLDRIKKQYEEQMNDVTQSYQYQSAQAQLNINYALETYWNTMARLSEEIDYATQDAQKLALQEMTNLNNAVWLSFTQQKQILLQLQADIDKIKATWLQSVLTQREKWNTTLAKQIAEAYWLDSDFLQIKQETSWWYEYTPISEWKKIGGLNTYIDSIQDLIDKNGKIRVGNCWEPVNDYLKALWLWTPITDSKSSKINLKNSDTPTIWSIMILDGSTIWSDLTKKYGHVAIVTGIDEQAWTITVLESNASTGLQYKTYNMSDVYGYFDPAKGYNDTPEEIDAKYDENAEELLKAATSFVENYSTLDLNESLDDVTLKNLINTYIWDGDSGIWREIYRGLKDNWINTVWKLFNALVDGDNPAHSAAENFCAWVPKYSKVTAAAQDFWKIRDMKFIDYLITAKGKWATFWNLTEWEWMKILRAANDVNSTMSQQDILKRYNDMIRHIEANRGKWANTEQNEQDVEPETVDLEEALEEIAETIGTWDVEVTPL